jgi:hypothetical protein
VYGNGVPDVNPKQRLALIISVSTTPLREDIASVAPVRIILPPKIYVPAAEASKHLILGCTETLVTALALVL